MTEEDNSAILEEIPLMLIAYEEPDIRKAMKALIRKWDYEAKFIADPLEVTQELGHRFYNIVFLDTMMCLKSRIELIPHIRKQSPATKIIMLTGYAEKENVIQALRQGASDFLEKPIDNKFFHHTVRRALYLQKVELESRRALKKVEHTNKELLSKEASLRRANEYLIETNKALSIFAQYVDGARSKTAKELVSKETSLRRTNEQLIETNKALSILAQNIDRARTETEFRISQQIKAAIMPLLKKFQESKYLNEFRVDLEVLMDFMDDLMSALRTNAQLANVLSATELRVAALIKNGLTTDEIAQHMFVSSFTVKSHRRNIRKKLRLDNSSINLKSYLQKNFGEQEVEEMGNLSGMET